MVNTEQNTNQNQMKQLNIDEIKIMLDTNIPNREVDKKKYSEDKYILFDKSMLYYPDTDTKIDTSKFNQYPYFTMDVAYPEMYLYRLTLQQKIEFFFNKDRMNAILKKNANFTEQNNEIVKQTGGKTESDVTIKDIKNKNEELKNIIQQSKEYDEKENCIMIEKIEGYRTDAETKDNTKIRYKNGEFLLGKSQLKINEVKIKTMDSYFDNKKKEFYNEIKNFEKENNEKLNNIFASKDDNTKRVSIQSFDTIDNPYKTKKIEDLKTSLKEYLLVLEKFVKSYENIFIKENGFTEKIKVINDEINNKNNFDDYFIKVNRIRNKNEGIQILIEDLINKLTNKLKDINEQQLEKKIDDIKKNFDEKLNKKKTEFETKLNNIKEELTILNTEYDKKINKTDESLITKNKLIEEQEEKKISNRINSEKNIRLMLEILFPTKYPFSNNVFSSFDSVIERNININTSFFDIFFNLFKSKNQYSYLKIDNKVYTVTQVIWLNDIYNHQKYSDLIEDYKMVEKNKIEEQKKLQILVYDLINNFKKKYSQTPIFSEEDIDYIKGQKDQNVKDYENGKRFSADIDTKIVNYLTELNKFTTNINNFNESIIYKSDIKQILQNAKNLIESYTEIIKERYFTTKDEFKQKIDIFKKEVENIKQNQYLFDYISKEGINTNVNEDYKELVNKQFTELTQFIEKINNFTVPYTSSNNLLQDLFINVLKNNQKQLSGKQTEETQQQEDSIEIFNTIMNTNYFNQVLRKNKPYVNTGVNILKSVKPKYEIFLQINFVGGELNDMNKSIIDCLYKGETNGSKLEYLLNGNMFNAWELVNDRMFFDLENSDVKKKIDEEKKKEEDKQKTEEDKKKSENQPPVKPETDKNGMKGGGIYKKFNTRKLREQFIKTRKRYSF